MILNRPMKLFGLSLGLLGVVAFGCSRPQPALAPTKPAEVTVDVPLAKTVTEYEDFTGRTEAVNAVDVRARVTGYLKKIHFKDGDDIEQGKVLMEIDAVLYEAERDRAESTLAGAKALVEQAKIELTHAQKDYDRLTKTGAGTSTSELDRTLVAAAVEEAGYQLVAAA